MSFASLKFLLFAVPVFAAYWGAPARLRKAVLLAAGCLFYAAWDWRFLGLLAVPTLADYWLGRLIAADRSSPRAGRLVWVSLVVNLGILGVFKYFGFFVDTLDALASGFGLQLSRPALSVALPVGISFYTFRSLSYTLDLWRGLAKPARSLADYAVFMTFFPLLGAGPIVRARQFLPQLARPALLDSGDLDAGLTRFALGFCKKAFIADTLGLYVVDPVFARPGAYGSPTLWLAALAYSAQIYADFSGYSSMAIGVSRLLGFKVGENFRFPYLSRNITEFWRRWHISLTSWFRDYLWWSLAKGIPFAGSIAARLRWSAALMAVFLASGLWHGAGWTFVVWGGLHGSWLALHQQWRARREAIDEASPAIPWMRALPAWAATQLAVGLAWVLFRAADFGAAATMIGGMARSSGTEALAVPWQAWIALLAFVADHAGGLLLERRPDLRDRVPTPVRGLAFAVLIVFLWHGTPSHASDFIYFRF